MTPNNQHPDPPTPAHQLRNPKQLRAHAGSIILTGIDTAITTRWDAAQQRAQRLTGTTNDEKINQLTDIFAKELGLLGAVAGGAAATPGIGTTTAIATTIADLSYFTIRSSELILTIAAIHGHTEPTVEEQRAWISCILIFGDTATKGFTKLAGEAGKGLGKKATAKIPTATLQAINRAAGRTLVTKYGTRRGIIAIGRAMPLGIGMAIGGTANYAGVQLLGRHANKFFTNLPYNTDKEPTS